MGQTPVFSNQGFSISFLIILLPKDGVLWGCGHVWNGEMCLDSFVEAFTPVKIEFFKPGTEKQIRKACPGWAFSLFLTEGAGGFSCGFNGDGRLCNGDDSGRQRLSAVPIVLECEETEIWDITAGFNCSYILSIDGIVFSSGNNSKGQLGIGSPAESAFTGTKIRALEYETICEVVTGYLWAIFRSRSHRLYACGANESGALTFESTNNHAVPLEITAFRKMGVRIDYVVATDRSALFVTPSRQVYGTGGADFGRLAQQKSQYSPVLVRELSNFQQLCAGRSENFLVFKKHGKFYGCGNSTLFGYVDEVGNSLIQSTPVELKSLPKDAKAKVRQLVTRRFGVYVLCSDGSVYSCGKGQNGELMTVADGRETGFDSGTFILAGKFELMKMDTGASSDVDKRERVEFMIEKIPIYSITLVLNANQASSKE